MYLRGEECTRERIGAWYIGDGYIREARDVSENDRDVLSDISKENFFEFFLNGKEL